MTSRDGPDNLMDYLRMLARPPANPSGGRPRDKREIPKAIPVRSESSRGRQHDDRRGGREARHERPGQEPAAHQSPDVGLLSLVLLALLKELSRKGVITEHEFRERLRQVDGADGQMDGAVPTGMLARALGLSKRSAHSGPVEKAIPMARSVEPAAAAPAPAAGGHSGSSRTAAFVPGQGETAPVHSEHERPAHAAPAASGSEEDAPASDGAPPEKPAEPLDPASLGQTDFGEYFGSGWDGSLGDIGDK